MFHDIAHELDEETRQRLQAAFERSMITPIATIFEDGISHGVLRDVQHGGAPPVTAAYLLLSMLQRPTGGADGKREGLAHKEHLAELIVDMMLHGLLAPGAEDDGELHESE